MNLQVLIQAREDQNWVCATYPKDLVLVLEKVVGEIFGIFSPISPIRIFGTPQR